MLNWGERRAGKPTASPAASDQCVCGRRLFSSMGSADPCAVSDTVADHSWWWENPDTRATLDLEFEIGPLPVGDTGTVHDRGRTMAGADRASTPERASTRSATPKVPPAVNEPSDAYTQMHYNSPVFGKGLSNEALDALKDRGYKGSALFTRREALLFAAQSPEAAAVVCQAAADAGGTSPSACECDWRWPTRSARPPPTRAGGHAHDLAVPRIPAYS